MNRFKSERGLAVPVSVAALLAVSTLVVATASSTIRSLSQSGRDWRVKQAIAAADAGVEAALYRLNFSQPAPTGNGACVDSRSALTTAAGPAEPRGWCDPALSPAEQEGDGSRFKYDISTEYPVNVNGEGGNDLYQRTI